MKHVDVLPRGTQRLYAEANARTASVGPDVDTLYGQLLHRMSPEALGAAIFAGVVRDTAVAAAERLPSRMRATLGIHLFGVAGSKIGAQPLDKLRPSHIEAWKVELEHRGLSESTIRSAYTILRAVLDTAVRDRALAQNPAHAVRRPRVRVTEAAYLTPDQVRSLLLASKPSRYAPLFELLVNTGLRRGEALALHWSDIDLDAKLLRVRGTLARVAGELVVTETKTPRSRRVIPLSPTAERLLRDVRANQRVERLRAGSMWQSTPYVFTTELGEPCDSRNALRALKVVIKGGQKVKPFMKPSH
ncbi:MAG TPA: tyrosine-type recombinase/integrase [Propionibacteriaceae bacterium]|nr:tyrosine-type recombinase/integrase [Propionibacteriaceae bacterium]